MDKIIGKQLPKKDQDNEHMGIHVSPNGRVDDGFYVHIYCLYALRTY